MSTRIQINTDDPCTLDLDGTLVEIEAGDVRSFTVTHYAHFDVLPEPPAPTPPAKPAGPSK